MGKSGAKWAKKPLIGGSPPSKSHIKHINHSHFFLIITCITIVIYVINRDINVRVIEEYFVLYLMGGISRYTLCFLGLFHLLYLILRGRK